MRLIDEPHLKPQAEREGKKHPDRALHFDAHRAPDCDSDVHSDRYLAINRWVLFFFRLDACAEVLFAFENAFLVKDLKSRCTAELRSG